MLFVFVVQLTAERIDVYTYSCVHFNIWTFHVPNSTMTLYVLVYTILRNIRGMKKFRDVDHPNSLSTAIRTRILLLLMVPTFSSARRRDFTGIRFRDIYIALDKCFYITVGLW